MYVNENKALDDNYYNQLKQTYNNNTLQSIITLYINNIEIQLSNHDQDHSIDLFVCLFVHMFGHITITIPDKIKKDIDD